MTQVALLELTEWNEYNAHEILTLGEPQMKLMNVDESTEVSSGAQPYYIKPMTITMQYLSLGDSLFSTAVFSCLMGHHSYHGYHGSHRGFGYGRGGPSPHLNAQSW